MFLPDENKIAKNQSSIGLGFFNPTFRLRHWDVISLCMQKEKKRTGKGIREGECATLFRTQVKGEGKSISSSVH